jgi:CRP/FNR family transcriptional regulator
MHRLCTQAEPAVNAIGTPSPLIIDNRKVERGALLFCAGGSFRSLFSIRSGFFKTTVTMLDGREQVTGFHMNGDVIGLDGIGGRWHTNNAVALENSQVCVFPFERLAGLALKVPELQNCLHGVLNQEIVRAHRVMLMLGSMHADERVAAFLVDLMDRLRERGWSDREVILRMSRAEIGSYLGLTLETVSRAFSVLAVKGIIQVKLRHIVVLDPERLCRISCGSRPSFAKPRAPRTETPVAIAGSPWLGALPV